MLCTSRDSRNGPTLADLAHALILLMLVQKVPDLTGKREVFVPSIKGLTHALNLSEEMRHIKDMFIVFAGSKKRQDCLTRAGCRESLEIVALHLVQDAPFGPHSISRLAFSTRAAHAMLQRQ